MNLPLESSGQNHRYGCRPQSPFEGGNSWQTIQREEHFQFSEPPPMARDLNGSFPPTADSFLPSTGPRVGLQKVLDKPKRPLSAYNIFFKIERQRMLDEQEAAAALQAETEVPPSLRGGRPAWRHRAPRIGFAEMARTISHRWKRIDPQDKQELEYIAAIGRQRYYEEVEEWRRSMRDMEEGGDDNHHHYYSPNDSHHHHHHHHATFNNANNLARADGFSHLEVLHNHYNENVIGQEDDYHLLQQQQQQHAPSTVHDNGGVLFNDANNNHFVPFANNDGDQGHDAAAKDPAMIIPEHFCEQPVMANHHQEAAEEDPHLVNTFNNNSNTVVIVTKDGDVRLAGECEPNDVSDFFGEQQHHTDAGTTMRRVVSASSTSTLSFSATAQQPGTSSTVQNSNYNWNVHPMAELANKMGDECCDLLISLFRG